MNLAGQDTSPFDPDNQEYHLKVKIVPHEVSYKDMQSTGNLGMLTRKVIGLVPVENTEMYRFFDAWLGIPGQLIEVIIRITHPCATLPIDQYARAAVMWPESQNQEEWEIRSCLEHHHLFLMSYGLSQILLAKPELHGKEIDITTCPKSFDSPDGAPTDGIYTGEELHTGKRREDLRVKHGVPRESLNPQRIVPPPGQQKINDFAPDRHGRVFPKLKG